jgi:hypothetical protein
LAVKGYQNLAGEALYVGKGNNKKELHNVFIYVKGTFQDTSLCVQKPLLASRKPYAMP